MRPSAFISPDDHGRMAAEITFHQRSDRAMSIDHTYVSPELQGRGVAADLVKAAADRFRAQRSQGRSRVFLRGEMVCAAPRGTGPAQKPERLKVPAAFIPGAPNRGGPACRKTFSAGCCAFFNLSSLKSCLIHRQMALPVLFLSQISPSKPFRRGCRTDPAFLYFLTGSAKIKVSF